MDFMDISKKRITVRQFSRTPVEEEKINHDSYSVRVGNFTQTARKTGGDREMTETQQMATIGLCVLGTMLTRFLPFIVFSENRETPSFIQYIGKYLPSAVFGMLVIYCLKDVSIFQGTHGLPELLSIAVTAM